MPMIAASFYVRCGNCGHEGDIHTFTTTPSGHDLPRSHYQCPACTHAWKRVAVGPWRTLGNVRVPHHIQIRQMPAQP